MTPPHFGAAARLAQIFPGDSQMAQRMRAFDWSAHELGSPARWPRNLRSALGLCLASSFPIALWWGKNLNFLYNDACIPLVGDAKHPHALGRPGRECWREVWDVVGPTLESVRATGQSAGFADTAVYFTRRLPAEEVFVRFSHDPILGADGRAVDGIFTPCTETTEQIVGARRSGTLRELGIRQAADDAEVACREVAGILAENRHDIPFAAIYLVDEPGTHAVLGATAGLPEADAPLPGSVSLAAGAASPWPLSSVLQTRRPAEVDLRGLGLRLPGGPWPEPAEKAVALPMMAPDKDAVSGFLVAGVSSRRILDAQYRAFFELVAGHAGAAVADSRARAEERRRTEAERAKAAFLSNVSHEFRAPLTLILGPLEDELRGNPHTSERLHLAHRNSLRLLKLVDALLDYSRIEAGRMDAIYEPTDLASLTAELASNFRAAVEKAGMELAVRCPPLPEPVYVDREMWEKIVLNLLSNAFKFTAQGSISVTQEVRGAAVELTVSDTGRGIPAEELPHIFERFYRVKWSKGRTLEGTGIGLALVQEMVKLHGGSIRVESVPDQGSAFTVAIPLGRAHLATDRIGPAHLPTAVAPMLRHWAEEASLAHADPSVPEDAVQPEDSEFARQGPPEAAKPARLRATIVWAEDNADMRQYVRRLLQGSYEVKAVANGKEAIVAVRRHLPDLVLADVMMPRYDGFDLLRELRADPQTCSIPVVLLSARAGEEALIEGREAGADDYVIKPFAARELLARIACNVNLARVRRESEQRIAGLVESAMDAIISIDEAQRIVLFNRAAEVMFRCPAAEAIGASIERFIPERFRDAHRRHIARFAETGTTSRAMGHHLGVLWGVRADGEEFPIEASISQVQLDWHRLLTVILRDITEKQRREEALVSLARDMENRVAEHARLLKEHNRMLEISREQFSLALKAGRACTFEWKIEADETCWSDDLLALYGLDGDEPGATEANWLDHIVPEDREAVGAAVADALGSGEFIHDFRIRRKDNGEIRWLSGRAKVVFDMTGKPQGMTGVQVDITERKVGEARLDNTRVRLEAILESVNEGVVIFDLTGRVLDMNPAARQMLYDRNVEKVHRHFAEFAETFEMYLPEGAEGRSLPLPPDDWPIARVVRGESFNDCELVVRRRSDGWQRFISHNGTPVRGAGGEVILGVLTLRDVTERRQAAQSLQESRRCLAVALEVSGSAVWEMKVADGVLHGEDRLFTMLGYAPGELHTMADWYALVHEDDRQGIPETVEEVIQGRRNGCRFEVRLRTKDGGWRWILSLAAAVERDARGQALRLVGTHTDITDRKLAEARIQELNADLEHRVRERTAELQYVNEALLQSNAELKHFAHAAAHDLQTPLRSIVGFTQLLQREVQGRVSERVDQWSSEVVENARRLQGLIQELLSYARLEVEGPPFEETDLHALCDEVLASLRGLIEGRGAEAVCGDLPALPVVRTQIAQVFQSLIENGIKYNKSKPPRVSIACERHGGEWVFSVADNGIGIESRHHEHIFQIFRRLHTYSQVPGTGIGLALCRRIVERHGGRIWVDSFPGKGSTFYFSLPARREEAS